MLLYLTVRPVGQSTPISDRCIFLKMGKYFARSGQTLECLTYRKNTKLLLYDII